MYNSLKKSLSITLALAVAITPFETAYADLYFKKPIKQLNVTATNGGNGGSSENPSNQAVADISTSVLSFGNVDVNQSSTLSVRLTNSGNAALGINSTPSISAAGNFTSTTNCTNILAAGAYCDVAVTYSPVLEGGVANGTLNIDTTVGLKSISITGTPVGHPAADYSTSSISFNDTAVGQTATASVLLQNSGTGTLTLTASPTYSGDGAFTHAPNCPSLLAVGQSCFDTVSFSPTDPGNFTGAVTFQTALGTKTISVSGKGLGAKLTAGTTNTDFGAVPTGSNKVLTYTFTNSGNIPATSVAATLTGNGSYAISSNTCNGSVGVGSTCSVGVTFTAETPGSAAAELTVSGANLTPLALSLSANSTGVSWSVVPATTTNFGDVLAGNTSSLQFTVTNTGNIPAVGAYASVAPYLNIDITNTTCGIWNNFVTLNAGASCTVTVAWSPDQSMQGTLTGARFTVALVAQPMAPQVNQALSGNALRENVVVVGSPSTAFGSVNVGATQDLLFTFQNTGNTAVHTIYPTVSGTNVTILSGGSCGASGAPVQLAAGAQCSVTVRYAPSAPGTLSGAALTLNFVGGGTIVQTLTGTGYGTAVALTTNPAGGSTDFGTVAYGSSGTIAMKYTNSGTAPVADLAVSGINGVTISGSTCGTTLAAGSSCTFNATFTPSSASQTLSGATAQVTSSNSSTVSSSYTGQAGASNVTLVSLATAGSTDFGSVSYGSNSTIQFRWTNNGNLPITVATPTVTPTTSLSVTSNTCSGTVLAGANCTFNVVYTPQSATDSLSSASVTVSGTGVTSQSKSLTGSATTVADPYWNNVVALFTFDNGLLVNTKGDLVASTIGSTAPTVTTSNVKYGSGAANFTGGGRIATTLPADAYTGANDFTVELWVRFGETNQTTYVANHAHQPNYAPWSIVKNNASLQLYISKGCGSWDIANGATIGTVATNTWYHVAISRNGSSIRTFLNGVLGSTVNVGTNSLCAQTGHLNLGGGDGGNNLLNGQIDEFRFTNGVGRYTGAFTPAQLSTH